MSTEASSHCTQHRANRCLKTTWIVANHLLTDFKNARTGGLSFCTDRFSIVVGSDVLSCYLRVYPNGNKESSNGIFNLFLGVDEFPSSYSKIEAGYQFYIKELGWRFANDREFTPKRREIGPPNSRCPTFDRIQSLTRLTTTIRIQIHKIFDKDNKDVPFPTPQISIDSEDAMIEDAKTSPQLPENVDWNMIVAKLEHIEQLLHIPSSHMLSRDNGKLLHIESEMDYYQSKAERIAAVKEWIGDCVGYPDYIDNFLDEGFDELSIFCDLSESDLIDIGVKKKGHRIKFMKAIRRLKEECNDDNCRQRHTYESENVLPSIEPIDSGLDSE